MVANYFEWTENDERCLENMFIWWTQQVPWEHAPDCDGIALHCCQHVYEYDCLQSIEGSSIGAWGLTILFDDGQGNKTKVEVGDKIYYRGEGLFELVKHEG